MEDEDREEGISLASVVASFLGIAFLLGFFILFFWWIAIGVERSNYKFCVEEYNKVYPDDKTGSLKYCLRSQS